MSEKNSKAVKFLSMLLVLIVAGAGVYFALSLRSKAEPPARKEREEKATSVKVITIAPATVVPRAKGYGPVVPAKTWQAVAETSGKITYLNPQVKEGELVKKGTLLVEIDRKTYELALKQATANLDAIKAQIEELDQREKNERENLAIQEQSLKLAARELERQKKLKEKQAVSQSTVDNQENSYLSQKLTVQQIKNSLQLYPAEKKLLKAQLAEAEANKENAELTLGYTRIVAPFDCRIATLNVEERQYAPTGTTLIDAYAIDSAEVRAQFSQSRMAMLGIDRDVSSENESGNKKTADKILASVRLSTGSSGGSTWPARFARYGETYDTLTRTVEVIVEVAEPYSVDNIKRTGTALVKGMHCEVSLRGVPMENRIVVPRSSVRAGYVSVVDKDNRLERRAVKVEMNLDDFSVISSGINVGDRIITTELVPAIEGTLLEPVEDTDYLKTLSAMAAGESEE